MYVCADDKLGERGDVRRAAPQENVVVAILTSASSGSERPSCHRQRKNDMYWWGGCVRDGYTVRSLAIRWLRLYGCRGVYVG